jgi:hypothetical protein
VPTLSDDLRTLGYEAFVYFYPLVTMDVTRRQAVNSPIGSTPGSGPPNRFSHMREFPTADFRAVVRPNFDTLYSSAWLDLTGGPVKLTAPDTDDRYYMLPCIDMWTDVFANPGKRTTGTDAGEWVIVGPGHTGRNAAVGQSAACLRLLPVGEAGPARHRAGQTVRRRPVQRGRRGRARGR